MSNLETVQTIYDAFGRGDIPTLLSKLDSNISWEDQAADHGVPWLKPGKGLDHVAAFFGVLAKELEITQFAPYNLLESGNNVVCLLDFGATAKATGTSFTDREAHVWEFGSGSKPIDFRHLCDTAKHLAAYKGQPVTA